MGTFPKSLRSKTKRHFRALRREKIYGPKEDERTERLAKKLAESEAGEGAADLEMDDGANAARGEFSDAVEEQDGTKEEVGASGSGDAMAVDAKKIDKRLFLSRRKQRLLKLKKKGKGKSGNVGKRKRII
ncbi:hypothetical protein DFJ74DRAFT_711494 [Hyaloraphidium curvatum]|nr:hypothetical protein DFJ74DRAFT_711494 [Hyaloraphidium curvatum]